ncbi:hypothetical protein MN608_00939 [Microdochium nivale]|nr:hypothetical protein MN608_00939 [Microdochium nivale]
MLLDVWRAISQDNSLGTTHTSSVTALGIKRDDSLSMAVSPLCETGFFVFKEGSTISPRRITPHHLHPPLPSTASGRASRSLDRKRPSSFPPEQAGFREAAVAGGESLPLVA